MRIFPTTCVLLLLATASACSPCVERCKVEADRLDRCLGEWGLEWADLGAFAAEDYEEQCTTAQEVWLNGLAAEERSSAQDACSDINSSLRAASSCDEVEEALVDWPGE